MIQNLICLCAIEYQSGRLTPHTRTEIHIFSETSLLLSVHLPIVRNSK
jgi:hypothetical protein